MLKQRPYPYGLSRKGLLPLQAAAQPRLALKQFSSTTANMSSNLNSQPAPTPVPAQTSKSNPFVLKTKYVEFAKTQASRPQFLHSLPITTTQPPSSNWKYGSPSPAPSSSESQHTTIDPQSPDQSMLSNYRFLISAIPRPIALVSSIATDGTRNLAPFSYFNVVAHDPPTFVIGFSAHAEKDTRRNLMEMGECVINIVSEHMVQAMNAASLDVGQEVSEWGLSGLTAAKSLNVRPDRVKEAVVSIEGKLLEMKSLDYHGKGALGQETGGLAIIEGTRFWIREDALNESGGVSEVLLDKLRPVVQLGGMMYGRVSEVFELPRPGLEQELADEQKGLRGVLEREKEKPVSDGSCTGLDYLVSNGVDHGTGI